MMIEKQTSPNKNPNNECEESNKKIIYNWVDKMKRIWIKHILLGPLFFRLLSYQHLYNWVDAATELDMNINVERVGGKKTMGTHF